MQFLTPAETIEHFGSAGFYVDTSEASYRIELCLNKQQAERQGRLGGRPSEDTSLPFLAHLLINWLPRASSRLLWISHWETHFLDFGEMILTVRQGLGETRSLSESPGHYFKDLPFEELDYLALSPEHLLEMNRLCGLIGLVILANWDGWLIASEGVDRIEFWEGNFFFHSVDKARLKAAESLMAEAKCSFKLR